MNGALLSSGGGSYDILVISSSLIRLTKRSISSSSNFNADPFQISNITTPSFTPSTDIRIHTHKVSGFKIDSTQTALIWQTSCTLPCHSCLISTPTICSSCYSNPLLVSSNIYYFENSTIKSCISDCPINFYLRTSTNSC